MTPFELIAPATEAEALAHLARSERGSVAVVAGGTDLLLDLDDGRLDPRTVLSLRALPWRRHRWDDGGLSIGATEPLRGLESDPRLAARLPALAQAIAAVGSPALRRQATVGGNLGRAAPASDLLPALLALDAQVEVVAAAGPRAVALDAFLKGSRATDLRPGELIRTVRIPEERPFSAYLWQRVRPANDISQLGVAAAWGPRDGRWRVALGGVPPRPVLAPRAASELRGPQPSRAEIDRGAERLAADPALVGDRRATDEHRRRLAAVLLSRAVAAAGIGGSDDR